MLRDFYQLFSLTVKATNATTSFRASDGTLHYDELKAFKLLDTLYKEYTTPNTSGDGYTNNQIRVVAYFAHLAHIQNNAALNEYLASDLVPIYRKNPEQFLSTLHDLPYLIPENCERLSAYFGFEGKNSDEKSEFLKANTQTIKKALGPELSAKCLAYF